jgi:hypothetical protein
VPERSHDGLKEQKRSIPWRRGLVVTSLLAELWVVRSNPARV